MPIVVFILAIGILIAIEVVIYARRGLDKLDVDVHFSQDIANHGDEIEVIEMAQNNKRIPLPFLILKFETPDAIKFKDMTNVSLSDNYYREDMLTMGGFSRHTRRIKVICCKRGFYNFARVNVSSADLLFLQKLTKDFTPDGSITILPELISSGELQTIMNVTISETISRRTLLTDPFAFSGIREYQPWDPMRSINWTASAKTGEFMVNQNTSTSNRRLNLFLNLEPYNTKNTLGLLEKSISLVYSYMLALSEEGVEVAFYTNSHDIVTGASIADNSSVGATSIEQRGVELARIDLSQPASPFSDVLDEYIEQSYTDVFNVIVSANYDPKLRQQLIRIKSQGKNILWVMPSHPGDVLSHRMVLESELESSFLRLEIGGGIT